MQLSQNPNEVQALSTGFYKYTKITKEQNACNQRNYVESNREFFFFNFNGHGVNLFHLKEMINWFFLLIFFIKLNCHVLFGYFGISFV